MLIYKCAKGNFAPWSIRAIILTQTLGRLFWATQYKVKWDLLSGPLCWVAHWFELYELHCKLQRCIGQTPYLSSILLWIRQCSNKQSVHTPQSLKTAYSKVCITQIRQQLNMSNDIYIYTRVVQSFLLQNLISNGISMMLLSSYNRAISQCTMVRSHDNTWVTAGSRSRSASSRQCW